MHVAFRVGSKWLGLPCNHVVKVTEVDGIFLVPLSEEKLIHGDWGISQLIFVANRKPRFAVIFEENDRTYAFGADEISMDRADVEIVDAQACMKELVHAE